MFLGVRAFIFAFSALCVLGCGRSGLVGDSASGGSAAEGAHAASSGSSSPVSGSSGSNASSGTSSTSVSASSGSTFPTCKIDDMSTWRTEQFHDQGDYDRAVGAVSNVPWVALKPKGGNIVLERLSVDASQGIVVDEKFEVPDSQVYPVSLDVDDQRFVFATTSGINWNGEVQVWRVDRQSGAITHVVVGPTPADPNETASAVVGLAGSGIVIGYGRLADPTGSVDLREDDLVHGWGVVTGSSSFTAVRSSSTAIDVYAGTNEKVHLEGGGITYSPMADPGWEAIGGQGGFVVDFANQIRLKNGTSEWLGAWPDTQISPPAIARLDGSRAAFSLNGELSPAVGYMNGNALAWLHIDPIDGSSGLGDGLVPVIEPGRLGVFYLGIDIPSPVQRLRYFGKACP